MSFEKRQQDFSLLRIAERQQSQVDTSKRAIKIVDNPILIVYNKLPFVETHVSGHHHQNRAFIEKSSKRCVVPRIRSLLVKTRTTQMKTDMIAATLRDEILGGRLTAGQRLTEAGLAARFGATRAVVRPVIQQLAMQGLLVCKSNCGAAVASEAPKAIRDVIVPIRRTVEAYALREVFSDLTAEDFQAWEQILEKMKMACENQDRHTVAECDLAFHRYIIEAAAQSDLLAIWETLVGRVRSHFRRTQRQLTRLMDIYDEHRELLDMFRGSDEDAAVRLLHAKIE